MKKCLLYKSIVCKSNIFQLETQIIVNRFLTKTKRITFIDFIGLFVTLFQTNF